jgi:hypothetical protein
VFLLPKLRWNLGYWNSPCDDVTCGGHGSCDTQGGVPQCTCDQGYYAPVENTTTCVNGTAPPRPCDDVTCGDHAICVTRIGVPQCICDQSQGYIVSPDNASACLNGTALREENYNSCQTVRKLWALHMHACMYVCVHTNVRVSKHMLFHRQARMAMGKGGCSLLAW